jgi:hypothetical protein
VRVSLPLSSEYKRGTGDLLEGALSTVYE